MPIQQMLLGTGGGSGTQNEYYFSSRVYLDPGSSYGAATGEYASFNETPNTLASGGYYGGSGYTGTSYMLTGWSHNLNVWDMLVIRLQAVNNNYIYLDSVTGSTGVTMANGASLPISNFQTRVVICDLGTNATTTAQASNIIQDYTHTYTLESYNVNNAAYSYIKTGNSSDPTPQLYAAYGQEHYYAICLDQRHPVGNSGIYMTSGSYINPSATLKSDSNNLSTIPSGYRYSSIFWQDGTHAMNVWYMTIPNFDASIFSDNATNYQRGMFPWYRWKRAE